MENTVSEKEEISMLDLNSAWRIVEIEPHSLEVREVYSDKEGKIVGWTSRAGIIWGIDEGDIRERIASMNKAFDLPILREKDFEGYQSPEETLKLEEAGYSALALDPEYANRRKRPPLKNSWD
jgi:hypothetical protein